MKRARGFTLIEIAVVLFIISLLIGAITSYVTAQVTAAKLALTQTRQAAIKAALTNFISRNNRLPCPAIAAKPAGDPLNGVEAPNPGTCSGAVFGFTVSTGVVPWSSLGLPSDAGIDGYNNRFTYQVAVAATANTLTAQTVSGISGQISVHSSGLGAVGRPGSFDNGNQLNDCRTVVTGGYSSAANPCAAVVIIVSHGPDGFGAYNDAGQQIGFSPAVTGQDELENAIVANSADSKFVMKPYSDIASNPFDDIVLPLTLNDLISGLTSAGSMQSALAVLNANFSVIKSALFTNAFQARTQAFNTCQGYTCAATGNCPGTGGTPTCEITTFSYPLLAPDAPDPPGSIPAVLALAANVTNDPWGRPIKYARTTATITSGTAASLTAFTLTSDGPDATPANTSDDIVTTVTVGEVRTQFSKF